MPLNFKAAAGGVIFPVYVHPSAKEDKIRVTDEIELFTREPAEGNKANVAVTKMLSRALGIPRRNVSIVRGSAGRVKEILIAGLSPEAIEQSLRKG